MLLLIFFACFNAVSTQNITVTHVFTSVKSYDILTYTTATTNPYVQVDMVITFKDHSVLAVIKDTNSYVPSTNAEDWTHINPLDHTQYDYQGLVTARNQNAWIISPGINQTLFIYLINFERKAMPSITLTISQPSTIQSKCATSNYHGSTFYCQVCPTGTIGCYCNLSNTVLEEYQNKQVVLLNGQYALFTLKAQSDAKISVGSTFGGVSIYFQYNHYFQERAGIVNYIHDADVVGHYHFAIPQRVTFQLKNGQHSIALGVLNFNSSTTQVWVQFEQQHVSVLLVVILAILGSVLLIGIVIIIIIVIKKFKQSQRVHDPNQNNSLFVRSSTIKLSPTEIQLLFPVINRSDIYPDLQSRSNLQKQSQGKAQYQCPICLCQIQSNHPIRIAYCKHMFHANCLTQWFQKQQNCPYCRQDYSKRATLGLYKQLAKESGKKLKKLQLVRAIVAPRLNQTLQTLKIEDIQDQINYK